MLPKIITTEIFLQKAREIHGQKYDYSKTVYVSAKDKVCIVCPVHGEFLQARFGTYHGKRVYLPVYLKEFEYVPLGLPLVILVDEKGNAESIRDFLSFDILDSVKAEKKIKKQNQNKC